jgi:hypothetical protein
MNDEQLMTQKELAAWIQRKERTIEADRLRGVGIPFVRIGRAVRYDPRVVREFLRRETWTSTRERGAA